MRFITEFKVDELRTYSLDEEAINNNIKSHKSYSLLRLGNLVGESFGWQNPVNNNKLHHRIEIEAFPMDKWLEFRVKLIKYLSNCIATKELPQALIIHEMFQELESFGKPSGDAITNQQLNK